MRYIKQDVLDILLKNKMGFVCGPRQVGKTTFAKSLLAKKAKETGYFNWDIPRDKKMILGDSVDFWQMRGLGRHPTIVLDEIHKFPRWKRLLKGFFDANQERLNVIVTGSGRLNVFQRGGDSLFGRYHLFHLMPYSLGEILRGRRLSVPAPDDLFHMIQNPPPRTAAEVWEHLWNYGGFPEPFHESSAKFYNQWQNDHQQLILREDLRDLSRIRDIGLIEQMVYLLPQRIGSPLSINSLREDLSVNFHTVKNWLRVLDYLYYLFSIRPFSGQLARTLNKEEKVYFYDWGELEDDGKKFENLMAVHLIKACCYWTDAGYGNFELWYVRDKEKREVDFLVTDKKVPCFMVEAKLGDSDIAPSLKYFSDRINVKHAFQVVGNVPHDYCVQRGRITVVSAKRFLHALP